MPKRGNAVHVSTHRRHYVGKDGVERDYETHLLRRSYREDGKVKNETVANLSHLPADLVEMIRASLAGQGGADHLGQVGGQVREGRDGVVLDLPIFAVGATQQVCLVVPFHPVLPDVVATVGRYVDRVTSFRHKRTLP